MYELISGWLEEKMASVMGVTAVGTMDALAKAHKELDHQNHNVRIMQLLAKSPMDEGD